MVGEEFPTYHIPWNTVRDVIWRCDFRSATVQCSHRSDCSQVRPKFHTYLGTVETSCRTALHILCACHAVFGQEGRQVVRAKLESWEAMPSSLNNNQPTSV